ncbi:MAG: hybrid sensor histidine kinase/response regulator [Actinomycetia bacterium]|nr:hybrid sensor histidine kinase/response regulator [Actinomycetes bacterium]
MSLEPSDVATRVHEARSNFLNGGGRNRLDVAFEPELPQLMADRRRIVQVVGKLLCNASRHSGEAPPIWINVGRQGAHVQVSVSDRGQGIPAELLPRLFRRLSPGDGTGLSRDPARPGLGLAICRGIVEAHGGRIRVESEGPGQGACITFTIRAAEPASTGPVPRSRRTARQLTRVLAVDDDPEALRQLRGALTRTGYHPVVTGNPAEVPRLMEEERPHLVLMDLMLPDGDGIGLMREITAKNDVPVIFVSADRQEELVSKALDMRICLNCGFVFCSSVSRRRSKVFLWSTIPSMRLSSRCSTAPVSSRRASVSSLIGATETVTVSVITSRNASARACTDPFGF